MQDPMSIKQQKCDLANDMLEDIDGAGKVSVTELLRFAGGASAG